MIKRLLVICGPTATGKTKLAISLANKFFGELVNADSRQIYRGMDIGTGKDLPARAKFNLKNQSLGIRNANFKVGYYLFDQVPLWLLDVVGPDYRFNVAHYLQIAIPVLNDIWLRGKLPILVGGTGFYLKALIDGLETVGIPPNQLLRQQLETLSLASLQKRLGEADRCRFEAMNQSDKKNPRRLIRAIEVSQGKKDLSSFSFTGLKDVKVLWIGLGSSLEKIDWKINRRVESRLNLGLVKEIKKLIDQGYSFSNSILGETIAYQEWQNFFQAPLELRDKLLPATVAAWSQDERQYARRQLTWFAKNKRINWFSGENQNLAREIAKMVNQWYIKKRNDQKS